MVAKDCISTFYLILYALKTQISCCSQMYVLCAYIIHILCNNVLDASSQYKINTAEMCIFYFPICKYIIDALAEWDVMTK